MARTRPRRMPSWSTPIPTGEPPARLSFWRGILAYVSFRSTLPSPGAADDLVGVATMLEALRVMASSPRRLTNSVVFRQSQSDGMSVFSLLSDAFPFFSFQWGRRISPGRFAPSVLKCSSVVRRSLTLFASRASVFITQHPLRSSIRAVINLEACGVGGPGSPFLILLVLSLASHYLARAAEIVFQVC